MATSVETLVESTRLRSGLRNNQLFSDDQIGGLLNSGYASLRDKLIVGNFAHWFKATYDFSLTSTDGGNVLDLSLVPRLEMVQGLDLRQGDQWVTVPMLQSFANRNAGNGLWPLGVSYSFNGQMGRNYEVDGNDLTVRPFTNAVGDYRLIYTPMQENLALPVTRAIEIDAADHAQNDGGFIQFVLTNGAFSDADEGGELTVTWDSPNEAWNADAAIITAVAPGNDTTVTTDIVWPGGSFTNPAAGTASITSQPVDTVPALPQSLTPWSEYIVLYASILIRTSRQQQIQELEVQLGQITARIVALTKQRSEGVRQAPITRGWGNIGGGG